MNGHSNLRPLAAVACLTALSIACASSGRISKPPEPPSPAVLSRDDAIDAARQQAGHLIQDRPVQETTAFYTTYGGAYQALDFDTPLPGSERPAGRTPTWLVIFIPPRRLLLLSARHIPLPPLAPPRYAGITRPHLNTRCRAPQETIRESRQCPYLKAS